MVTVCTVGYERKRLQELVDALRMAQVDAVIDVRLRNTSHLAGYTRKEDLGFLLQEGFGIAYEHHPELAPEDDILDGYKQGGDWEQYEQRFRTLLRQRQAEDIGRSILARYRAPCLLCYEASPQRCHRRLVAEWWAENIPGVEPRHL